MGRSNFDIVQANSFIDANGDAIGGGGGGGGTTFEYAGSENGADLWTAAATGIGFNDANQNDAFRLSIVAVDAEGEVWRVYRENAEGWGIGYDRVCGTNSVPQAGTYTVLSAWVTNV